MTDFGCQSISECKGNLITTLAQGWLKDCADAETNGNPQACSPSDLYAFSVMPYYDSTLFQVIRALQSGQRFGTKPALCRHD